MIFMKDTTNINSDRNIVIKILKGDEAAVGLFYKNNKSGLFSFILQRIEDRSDAEEVLQDVFLSAIMALRDFTFKCSLSTFLFSIAKNKIVDYYRKKRIKAVVFSKFFGFEDLISELLKPDEEFENEEIRRKFYKVLNSLRPKYQRVIKLKYIEGKKLSEIAEIISESIKSVESTLFRARKEFVVIWESKKILTKGYLNG
jgi:RNA polymerase sigma-70 factor, ECF subfamily